MEIDAATHANSAPVSFLDKFATIFTPADTGAQTNVTEARVLTFFRTLSERDSRVRNVVDPAKMVGWSDEPQTTEEERKGEAKRADAMGLNGNIPTISNGMESREGFVNADRSSTRPSQPKIQPSSNVKSAPAMCSEMREVFELADKKMANRMEDAPDSFRQQQSKSPGTAVVDEPQEHDFTLKKTHENHKDNFETNDQAQLCPEVQQKFVSDGVRESKELGAFTHRIREDQTLNIDCQDQPTDQSQKNTSGQDERSDANSDKLSRSNSDNHMFIGNFNEVISLESNTLEAKITHTEERSNDHLSAPLVCGNHADNAYQDEPTKSSSKPERSPNVNTVNPLGNNKNDNVSAASQDSFSDFNQTSANHPDISAVNTVSDVTTNSISEEAIARSSSTGLQMDEKSEQEACAVSPDQPEKSAKGLSVDVSTIAKESTGHLSPTSEGTGPSSPDKIPQTSSMAHVAPTDVSGARDYPNGDNSVASDSSDTNTRASVDPVHSVHERNHPSAQENSNSTESEKHEEGGKNEITDVEKREEDNIATDIPSSPVSPLESPTVDAASAHPHDRPTQLQSIFSGLRKRGSAGEEKEATDKPSVTQDQRTKPFRRSLFPDQEHAKGGLGEPRGSFLEQLSQLLNLEVKKMEEKTDEQRQMDESQTWSVEGEIRDEAEEKQPKEKKEEKEKRKGEEEEEEVVGETMENMGSAPAAKPVEETKIPTGPESALDAFKAFFTPKPMKKPTLDRADLETLKRKFRSDKEMLRGIFERNSPKTNSKVG